MKIILINQMMNNKLNKKIKQRVKYFFIRMLINLFNSKRWKIKTGPKLYLICPINKN